MSAKLILRFADFGYDTIQEHKVYTEEPGLGGSVWWGWWKKDGVDLDFRTELAQLRPPIWVGLFNRKGKFYRCRAEAIRVARETDRIASPVPEQTPAYYRQHACAAWFNLSQIVEITRAEFIREFGPVPSDERTLYLQFRMNLEEAAAPTIPEPFYADGDTILHLSDLHFGEDHGYPDKSFGAESSLYDRLVRDLTGLEVQIGLVVVSGDVLTRCNANRFYDVEEFLRRLADVLKVDVGRQLVVVPGNHDIELSEKRDEVVAKAIAFPHERPFRDFLRRLHGNPYGIARVERVSLRGLLVEVMAMNSVRLRYKPLKEYGYVDWSLYQDMLPAPTLGAPIPFRIAVLHHHLISAFPVEMPVEDRPISITVDAGEILEGLQRLRFRLVLHGHQHVPRVSKVARALRNEDGSLGSLEHPIFVIGGGSSGAKRLYDPMPLNTYSLLTPSHDGITFWIRQYNKGREPDTYVKHKLTW